MSFSEFYQRSINEPEQFWAEQARRIDWQTPFTQTLDHSNPPFARWFCEGRTNLCHNAIDRWLEKQPEALALIAVSSETEEERMYVGYFVVFSMVYFTALYLTNRSFFGSFVSKLRKR